MLVQLNGQYTRVMAHPAVDYNAGGGGWVDPDSAGPAPVPSEGRAARELRRRQQGQAPPIRAEGTFLFQGSDVVEQPGKPAPPLTSTTGSGQQQ